MKPYNQKMWGDILLALMDECQSTGQIAYELQARLARVRAELILMHHFDLVEPIGIRSDDGPLRASGYYLDLLWETTRHTKEHIDTNPGCRGCRIREQLLLTDLLYE